MYKSYVSENLKCFKLMKNLLLFYYHYQSFLSAQISKEDVI